MPLNVWNWDVIAWHFGQSFWNGSNGQIDRLIQLPTYVCKSGPQTAPVYLHIYLTLPLGFSTEENCMKYATCYVYKIFGHIIMANRGIIWIQIDGFNGNSQRALEAPRYVCIVLFKFQACINSARRGTGFSLAARV